MNLQDDEGDSALGLAAFTGRNDLCGLLLEVGESSYVCAHMCMEEGKGLMMLMNV